MEHSTLQGGLLNTEIVKSFRKFLKLTLGPCPLKRMQTWTAERHSWDNQAAYKKQREASLDGTWKKQRPTDLPGEDSL